jgi:hypothetical protein
MSRKPSSTPKLGARAAPIEASKKEARPPSITLRRPSTSPSRPDGGWPAISTIK